MFDRLDTQSFEYFDFETSHQKKNFACKKNLKVKKGQGIYCMIYYLPHVLAMCRTFAKSVTNQL